MARRKTKKSPSSKSRSGSRSGGSRSGKSMYPGRSAGRPSFGPGLFGLLGGRGGGPPGGIGSFKSQPFTGLSSVPEGNYFGGGSNFATGAPTMPTSFDGKSGFYSGNTSAIQDRFDPRNFGGPLGGPAVR